MLSFIGDPFEGLEDSSKQTATVPGPGNPEKGGDGTNGEDTPEIMGLLKSCRRVLSLRKNGAVDHVFEVGDLVYDSRTEEHGVVLGEKPDLENLPAQTSNITTKRTKVGETRTYIVLTITTDQQTGQRKTRIRYVNRHNLRLIGEDRNTMTDLDKFCSKQCIQECSPVCSLYKYKRVKDTE